MADNTDSVMVVLDRNGNAVPNGWTDVGNDMMARRVSYPDYRKLHRNNRKIVALFVFQQNPSGATPFKNEFSGNDDYSFEYDPVNFCIRACKHNAAGGGAGTDRADFPEVANGGNAANTQEHWPKESGQVPMLGVVFQDAAPSTAKLNAARALTTDDVPLG